jgi:hypothetical protein
MRRSWPSTLSVVGRLDGREDSCEIERSGGAAAATSPHDPVLVTGRWTEELGTILVGVRNVQLSCEESLGARSAAFCRPAKCDGGEVLRIVSLLHKRIEKVLALLRRYDDRPHAGQARSCVSGGAPQPWEASEPRRHTTTFDTRHDTTSAGRHHHRGRLAGAHFWPRK